MNAQEIFNLACTEYNKIQTEIDELGGLVKQVYPDFDVSISKKQFDFILQSILLKVAIANGEFCEIEKQFISKITENEDITHLLTNSRGDHLSWEQLIKAGVEGVEFVLDKLSDFIKDKTMNFLTPFAAMDTVMEKDYLANIKESMFTIGHCFLAIDGEVGDDEKDVAANAFAEFTATWAYMIELGSQNKEAGEDECLSNDSLSSGSLKNKK